MHAITLTDGTTTATLYSLTGTFPTGWKLAAREEDEETVAESLDLLIQGASIAAVSTAVRTIETLLDDAQRRARTRVGARIFLTVQWDGETDAWRSEVLGGRLELHGAAEQYSLRAIEGTLALTRRTYWEGPETPLPLTNSNGSNDTAGLTVWNHDDSGTGHDNYVQIAATDVVGSLPAPVKIELKNTTTSGARTWETIVLANNVYSDPANFPHMLEAEARTAGGSVSANGNASGGNELQLSGYSSGQQVDWDLSAALLQKAGGRWFRLLLVRRLRNGSAAQAETVQAQILDSGSSFALYTQPQETALTPATPSYTPLVDIGALPLPPSGYDSAWGALKLRLTFRVASGTASTYLDYLQLTPTDSRRVLTLRPASVASNALVVDNGIDGLAYVETSGVRNAFVLPDSTPLTVWPGRLQRIYVQAGSATYTAIDDKWAVRLWYRPRRLTI